MKLLSLVILISFFSCQKPHTTVDEVKRIISTLSSDEMRGRGNFTEDIKRASDFIASEFKTIGLETIDPSGSYEQAFSIYSIAGKSQALKINGKKFKDEEFFFSAKTAELRWNETGLNILSLGKKENPRQLFSMLRSATGKTLIFVDPAHKEIFARYKSYMSRAMRSLELKEEGNTVVVLSKPLKIKSCDIQYTSTIDKLPLNNVIGKIEGKRKNEFVLFSAHYDHLGVKAGEDSIYNGANDDASGVTAIISLAKYFKIMGQPERTLLFAAFTAEEIGGYGSQYFSKQLNPDEIVAMFNIEMIGIPAVSGPNSCWITGFDRSDFGKILQDAVKKTKYKFYADPYPNQNLFYRSDNATLARLGVPAHSLSTTPIDVDKNYHQASDEVSTLDLEHLTNTINAIALGSATIVSGKATPSRIDKSKVK